MYAPDAAVGDLYGNGVDCDGTTLVISAYGDDEAASATGSLYLYTRVNGAWTFDQKLNHGPPVSFDQLGFSCSVSGDTIMASTNDDIGAVNSGAVIVFKRTEGVWAQVQKVKAPTPINGVFFGSGVLVRGDTAIIGAWSDRTNGAASGRVYVYRNIEGTWTYQNDFFAEDAAANDEFGFALAYSDGMLFASRGSRNQVEVYQIDEDGQETFVTSFTGTGLDPNDDFGSALSYYNGILAIGARFQNSQAGAVYLFQRDGSGTWTQTRKIESPGNSGSPGDRFGTGLALFGYNLFVGAPFDDDNSLANSGAVYQYRLCR
jgi:hypothetical protein